jgi:mannose-1-phosphate guanylyltransferase/phosphomannomutase
MRFKTEDLSVTGVILAGGKGSRSIDPEKPKCLEFIGEKPLLEWHFDYLKKAGVDEIVLSTGFASEQISSWLQSNQSKITFPFRVIQDFEQIGTLNAIALISQKLTTQVSVIIPGDIFCNSSLQNFASKFDTSKFDVCAITHPNLHPESSDIIDHTNGVSFISKKTKRVMPHPNNALSGVMFAKNAILHDLDVGSGDYENTLIPNAATLNKFTYLTTTDYISDTGTKDRIERVRLDYKSGAITRRNLSSPHIALIDLDDTVLRDMGSQRFDNPEFFEDVPDFLKCLNRAGIHVHIITNQPSLAKGEVDFERFFRFKNKLEMLAAENGFFWDGFHYCPHHPDIGYLGEVATLKMQCNCRKPFTGLLDQVLACYEGGARFLGMIGDSLRDSEFSNNAKVEFFHILRNSKECLITKKHVCVSSLANIKELII